jgi:hypothetical protein
LLRPFLTASEGLQSFSHMRRAPDFVWSSTSTRLYAVFLLHAHMLLSELTSRTRDTSLIADEFRACPRRVREPSLFAGAAYPVAIELRCCWPWWSFATSVCMGEAPAIVGVNRQANQHARLTFFSNIYYSVACIESQAFLNIFLAVLNALYSQGTSRDSDDLIACELRPTLLC